MTAAHTDLAGPVARYASRLHEVIGYDHHVASPLGAWLLLALCGPASDGANRVALTEALGCDIDVAASVAADLLAHPHPLVAAAAALWHAPGSVSDQWLSGLPAEVMQTPRIPGQPELDAWARRHTFGLIDRFPIKVDPAVYLILASALATKVSWECPFDLAAGSELGQQSPWAQRLARVLRAPRQHGHSALIAATEGAGDVAMHVAAAHGGLAVASITAAPGVAPADVMAAAHTLAVAHVVGQPVQRRSLFDLPLGDGAAWTIREEMSADAGERCDTVLPAWSASSTHDLGDPVLGFAAAAASLAVNAGDPWEARQGAMARYSRTGFEAAAVTAMAIRLSMRMPCRGPMRTAELRFGHPFAVVAVTVDEPGGRRSGRDGHGPWHGIPVFSAWVADPQDAVADPEDAIGDPEEATGHQETATGHPEKATGDPS
jgi:hypothetical protein